MADFIKTFPSVSAEEYKWQWTIPQIKIASCDITHIVYQKENKPKEKSYDNPYDFMSDLGIPIVKK